MRHLVTLSNGSKVILQELDDELSLQLVTREGDDVVGQGIVSFAFDGVRVSAHSGDAVFHMVDDLMSHGPDCPNGQVIDYDSLLNEIYVSLPTKGDECEQDKDSMEQEGIED